ncbi:hypothetical protein BJV74DRAFT_169530 [Russula compacta]|nr:hypothetical protein BJV74DRAFT_169530 [Russula compacta]
MISGGRALHRTAPRQGYIRSTLAMTPCAGWPNPIGGDHPAYSRGHPGLSAHSGGMRGRFGVWPSFLELEGRGNSDLKSVDVTLRAHAVRGRRRAIIGYRSRARVENCGRVPGFGGRKNGPPSRPGIS